MKNLNLKKGFTPSLENDIALKRKSKMPFFSAGFTVLESIIAIAVVSLAISGAFAAVRTGLSSSSQAKEQTKAYYLANEAVEMIRNKRDSNGLDILVNGGSSTWLTGIAENASDPCSFGNTCYVDVYNNALVRCGAEWDSCPVLKQDPNTYLYQYTTGSDSIYKREIQIENTSATEISVTIRISWSHAGIAREFKTKTIFTNWF